MSEPLNLAAIGCGGIAQAYLTALTQVDELRLIAACDVQKAPRQKVTADYGVPCYENIDELLEKYDHVIVDGPPVTGFADSRIISLMVDGVLLVTSVGVTQRHMLRSSIEELHRVRGRILGTIVNRLVPKRSGKYGYGYYYYQQYYNHDDESIENDEKQYLPRGD